ncbi:MAG: PIG-L family deacetylase [Anaerolineae bacterium]|nr:PIG-L family deacetylase [Anaerolineae bacterium]
MKRLLIAYAHPDDESFGLGSVIARYVAQGVQVTLICATNGDVGTVPEEHLNGHDSVASVRLAELDCAASVLGIHEVIKFRYRDSGMMGSPDNEHPNALWKAPLDQVAARIAEVMRRVKPQVVITFDPYGGYGHPDHIKMHQATLAAWKLVQNDADRPTKLYFSTFPKTWIRLGVMLVRLVGKDPRKLGRNNDLDLQAMIDATTPVHTRIDVSAYYEVGMRAAACHASQANPRDVGGNGIGQSLARWFSRNALFTRAEPPPRPGEPVERDLFAGI